VLIVFTKTTEISFKEASNKFFIFVLRLSKSVFNDKPAFLLNNQENTTKQIKIKVSSFNSIILLKVSSVDNNIK
jgi:hypothetical protein